MKGAEISRACSTHGVIKKACEVVVGKPEGKKELETYTYTHRWKILKWI
jgi:hypothetical protein